MKELVTLGISIAIRCDYCIAFHVANCLKAGATREEILEVCGVAIGMGGGPSYTYTAMVLDAVDALSKEKCRSLPACGGPEIRMTSQRRNPKDE